MPFLAAVVLQAQAAVFAPPLGVPIRVVKERTQGEGDARFSVHLERLVRFARDGAGYRAEVRMVSAEAGPRADIGAMVQAGFAGLAGRTIVVRLDMDGKLVGVDDREALWGRFCTAIAALVAAKHDKSADQAAAGERMTAALRAMAPERQLAVLGSLVSALVAEAVGDPGTRPIRLPGSSPFGGTADLTGTRTVTGSHIATRAAADVPGQDGASAHIAIERDEDVDPRTGLISAQFETLRTSLGTGPDARSTDRISSLRITVEPETNWPG